MHRGSGSEAYGTRFRRNGKDLFQSACQASFISGKTWVDEKGQNQEKGKLERNRPYGGSQPQLSSRNRHCGIASNNIQYLDSERSGRRATIAAEASIRQSDISPVPYWHDYGGLLDAFCSAWLHRHTTHILTEGLSPPRKTENRSNLAGENCFECDLPINLATCHLVAPEHMIFL
jgi:hypothetical protein